MDITWKDFSGDWEGRNKGGKVRGRRSKTGRHKIDGEQSKMIQETENSRNIRTTHGHELRGRMLERGGMQGGGGIKWVKLGKL